MKKLVALIAVIGYFFAGPMSYSGNNEHMQIDDIPVPYDLPQPQ